MIILGISSDDDMNIRPATERILPATHVIAAGHRYTPCLGLLMRRREHIDELLDVA